MTYLIIFLAIFIQSLSSFGAGLFAVPLLTFIYEPKFIIPPFSLLVLTFNIIVLFEVREKIKWNVLLVIISGALIGVPFGVFSLKNLNPEILRFLISFITFFMGVYFLTGQKFRMKEKKIILFLAGLLSGFFSGSCAMGGPPIIILGISMKWEKETFRKTLLTYFAIMGSMSNFLFLKNGLFNSLNLKILLFAFIPAAFASFLGIKVKNKLSEEKFKRIVLLLIITIGIIGVIKSILKFIK